MKVIFEKSKGTKNTIQFSEVTDREMPVCRTIYINKEVVKELGIGERVEITIEKA